MEKIGYPDRNSVTWPVAIAVFFSSTMLVPTDTAATQPLQPPSITGELPPPISAHKPVPELSLSEEKLLLNQVIRNIKAEQERLKQEAEARQKAQEEASRLKAAKARASKTVSRKLDYQVATSSDLLNYALSFQGVPYRWGGTNPETGLDCSGYTQLVFRKFGVNLPRTSAMQFRVGIGIARSGLLPGDLVFFSTNGAGASHVGIYLGDGKFISSTTRGVRVQDINDNYWGRYYRGARRVL